MHPPFDRAKTDWAECNPGVASSYIFSKKPGDKVTISGPYGEFFINESDSEMFMLVEELEWLLCVHIYMNCLEHLQTGRKVTFWYGGRSKRELFYYDHFRALEKDYPNFKFYIALSEPYGRRQLECKRRSRG